MRLCIKCLWFYIQFFSFSFVFLFFCVSSFFLFSFFFWYIFLVSFGCKRNLPKTRPSLSPHKERPIPPTIDSTEAALKIYIKVRMLNDMWTVFLLFNRRATPDQFREPYNLFEPPSTSLFELGVYTLWRQVFNSSSFSSFLFSRILSLIHVFFHFLVIRYWRPPCSCWALCPSHTQSDGNRGCEGERKRMKYEGNHMLFIIHIEKWETLVMPLVNGEKVLLHWIHLNYRTPSSRMTSTVNRIYMCVIAYSFSFFCMYFYWRVVLTTNKEEKVDHVTMWRERHIVSAFITTEGVCVRVREKNYIGGGLVYAAWDWLLSHIHSSSSQAVGIHRF